MPTKDMLPRIIRDQLEKMSLVDLMDKIETYGFENEAGYLTNTIHWIELKGRIVLLQELIPRPGEGHGQQQPAQSDHGDAKPQGEAAKEEGAKA